MLDEESLIARAQRGDAHAYEALVREYEQLAFRVAWFITRDPQEASDAAQDAFLRVYHNLPSFKRGQPFRPWLLRIVTNQSLNRVKSRQRRERMGERYAQQVTMATENPSPERTVFEHARDERLLEAVNRLAEDEQLLVSLRYFLELPESDVASALKIPVGTVKSRLYRTLARLREIIQREYPDLRELAT